MLPEIMVFSYFYLLTEAVTQVASLAHKENLLPGEHLVDARPMVSGGKEFGGQGETLAGVAAFPCQGLM